MINPLRYRDNYFPFSMILKQIKRASILDIAFAGLAVVVLALAMVGVAYMLAYFPQDVTAPPVEWSLKTGLALLVFSIPFVLIALVVKKTNLGYDDIFKTVLMTAAIAISVVGVAYIFSLLSEVSTYISPPLGWSFNAGLTLLLFAVPVLLIGTICATSG